jgi:hypothetical protein
MKTYNTDTSQLRAKDNSLFWNDGLLAEFPTEVCEFGRVDERVFVVIDGDIAPPNMEYAGSNFWCMNLSGGLLWKAHQLNSRYSECSIYLKPHRYPNFRGERYHDMSLVSADDCLMAFTFIGRDEPLLIDLSTGKPAVRGGFLDDNKTNNYIAFHKIRTARGANLRRTPVEWPAEFHQLMKASDALQVALKMTKKEMDEQIVALVSGFKDVDRTPAPYDPVNSIRLNFDSYCRERMNTFWGSDSVPLKSLDLSKLVDRFLAEIGVDIAPRGSFYRWP